MSFLIVVNDVHSLAAVGKNALHERKRNALFFMQGRQGCYDGCNLLLTTIAVCYRCTQKLFLRHLGSIPPRSHCARHRTRYCAVHIYSNTRAEAVRSVQGPSSSISFMRLYRVPCTLADYGTLHQTGLIGRMHSVICIAAFSVRETSFRGV